VHERARRLVAGLAPGPQGLEPLLAFDAALKRDGLNPGTSADFTVATLFCDVLSQCRSGK